MAMNEVLNNAPPQRVWWVRVGAGLGVIALLALLAPLIWGAVSAGLGLVALALVGLLGFGVMQALPLLAQKLENRLLAARKSEARANPIEQLQSFLLQKRQRVQQFRQAVVQIGTQIKGLADMLEQRKRDKPGYDATRQEKSLQAMRAAHAQLVDKANRAEDALVQLDSVIEDKKFEWQFGKAGQAAIQSLNATSGQELLDEMLADEAFASVRDNFNQVFSELELEATRLSGAKSLEFDDGLSIDLSAIQIPLAEQVKRG